MWSESMRGGEWQEKSCKTFQDRFAIFLFCPKFYRTQLKRFNPAINIYTHTFLGYCGFSEEN